MFIVTEQINFKKNKLTNKDKNSTVVWVMVA